MKGEGSMGACVGTLIVIVIIILCPDCHPLPSQLPPPAVATAIFGTAAAAVGAIAAVATIASGDVCGLPPPPWLPSHMVWVSQMGDVDVSPLGVIGADGGAW